MALDRSHYDRAVDRLSEIYHGLAPLTRYSVQMIAAGSVFGVLVALFPIAAFGIPALFLVGFGTLTLGYSVRKRLPRVARGIVTLGYLLVLVCLITLPVTLLTGGNPLVYSSVLMGLGLFIYMMGFGVAPWELVIRRNGRSIINEIRS